MTNAVSYNKSVTGVAELTYYTVEASTNLHEWAPVQNFVAPALPFLLSDPQAPLYPQRFCSVRAEPKSALLRPTGEACLKCNGLPIGLVFSAN